MSQKVQVLLVDDLDGSEAAETVTFGLDGTTFEIDLNEHNVSVLRETLSPFVENARKVGRVNGKRVRRNGTPQSTTNGSGPSPKDVREWAAANGVEVGQKGRVPQAVVDQYLAANGE